MVGEFLRIALGNLWRMKLRTSLTVVGVAVGIGALVAMLSFALGMQRNVAEQFDKLGLFETLHVMPPSVLDEELPRGQAQERQVRDEGAPEQPGAREPDGASSPRRTGRQGRPILDDALVDRIAEIPGVQSVYPQDSFDANVSVRDTVIQASVEVLPPGFPSLRSGVEIRAGRFFEDEDALEAVLHERFVRELGLTPDAVIGDTLRIQTAGMGAIALAFSDRLILRLRISPGAREGLSTLSRGLLPLFGRNELRLRVCGVIQVESAFGFRVRDIVVPPGAVRGLDRMSFSDPVELLSRLSSTGSEGYPLAVVVVENDRDLPAVQDSVQALGLRTFSFAEQFAEVKRQFLIFDLMVGVLGFIALFVASLGIANTMVMSILERKREIGVLKSLGAEEGQVRLLFLVESGLIGLIGSLGGLVLGWAVSRIAAVVVRRIMVAQGGPDLDMFYLHPLLALGGVLFGLCVSLAAGLYPAARAAAVDPVRALRDE